MFQFNIMNYQQKTFSIFLCGDVMTGRGIDQILPFPSGPQLYESYVTDARDYVLLAQEKNAKFIYPVSMDYIWGDALSIWHQQKPDIKIINLETAITQCDDYWPHKGINYRMHPRNIDIFKVAGMNICTLANNHILDWGYSGLNETILTLKKANIQFSGVGETITEAIQPAIFNLDFKKRILVFSAGTASSGVPSTWLASNNKPGICYLEEINPDSLEYIAENIKQHKKPGDIVIFSIHWGSNWGYHIPEQFEFFAHGLIDEASVDVVFGHSSHHFRPMEIYHGKPIFYGCGDFMNDYEGISGHEEYRSNLTLMYFIEFDISSLQLNKIILIPLQIKNFQLQRASLSDCKWVLSVLNKFKFNMQFGLCDKKLVYVR